MFLARWFECDIPRFTLLCLIAALVSGCGPGGYSGPTGTVTGTVTLNGDPVPEGSTVTFVSDDGFTAAGKVGPGGAYRLSSAGKEEIPVSTYRAMVHPPAAGASADVSDAEYDRMMQASAEGEVADTAPANAIPSQYQSTGTSKLSYEVKEGPNTIPIELK